MLGRKLRSYLGPFQGPPDPDTELSAKVRRADRGGFDGWAGGTPAVRFARYARGVGGRATPDLRPGL